MIVDELSNIVESNPIGRKKRSADEPEKARQSFNSDYSYFGHDPNDADDGDETTNILSLTLSLSSLLGGATQIDNYYYYDVSRDTDSHERILRFIIL